MKTKHAIVVGAGLGGLSAAAFLSKNGFKVDVFERNPHPGGYACSFVRGRFEFETALHELSGIGPPENRGSCYKVLDACGVADRVEFLPIHEFYTSVFPDFTVTIPHGWEAAEEAYASQFPR
ncbi:MAG: phytoene desaturase family protein, partial [Candidatus Geothermincolia bacterium]